MMRTANLRYLWGRAALCAAVLTAGAAAPAVADDGAYRLGVDDVISIRVLYHADFSVESATVRPDGKINVPVAGDLQVAGRTVLEVAEAVTEALQAELREPQVSVRLVRRYAEPVYVVGAVRSPGAVSVREPVTVAEAIALAGGLSPSAAPRYGVLIDRDGGQTRIDVLAGLAGRAPGGAATIAPGETLVVSAQFLVSVVGQVRAPGRYPAEEGDRAADALAAAGGLREEAAQVGRLVRADGAAIDLDLAAIVESGDAAGNPPLEPGDLIVVPELARRVTLVGAFAAPGKYDFDEGDRVSHAVALARGVEDDARLTAALLVRGDGSSQPVDLEALLQGEAGDDPLVADGDTLILPREVDRVAVLGMVVHPGLLPIDPDMTLMDALAAAGGWSQDGSRPTQTILWRRADGEPQMTFIDAQALMLGDTEIENPRLQPGDIVFVPHKSAVSRDEAARMLLGISGLLRLLF